MARKIDENGIGRHLGERFCRSGPLFGPFLAPTWVPDWALWADFRPTFATFWPTVGSHVIFLCSRVLGEAPGIDLGCPGEPPGKDFGSFSASLWSFVAFYFCSNFVPSLSKFRISCCSTVCVSPLLPCLQLQGRWSRAAC